MLYLQVESDFPQNGWSIHSAEVALPAEFLQQHSSSCFVHLFFLSVSQGITHEYNSECSHEDQGDVFTPYTTCPLLMRVFLHVGPSWSTSLHHNPRFNPGYWMHLSDRNDVLIFLSLNYL